MGTIKVDELLKQWRLEELEQERAMGQVLQHLLILYEMVNGLQAEHIKLENKVNALNVTLYNLRADVDGLIAHTKMLPSGVSIEPDRGQSQRGRKKRGGNPNLTES